MGDLRDQLLKAGLVSAEQAKKATRDERQDHQAKGHRQKDRERQQQLQAPAEKLADKAAAERQRAQAERSEVELKEARLRAKQLAQSGKVEGRFKGNRRWYYTSRRGVVPYLELSDEGVALLEQGQAALAEAPGGDAWLVTPECAGKLRELEADWVRVWNRAPPAAPAKPTSG